MGNDGQGGDGVMDNELLSIQLLLLDHELWEDHAEYLGSEL
jgi:hypothetical protein